MPTKTMKIAFLRGGTIPAAVLNEKKDRKCQPREAVRVPRDYGEHLVHDKFAYEVTGKARAESATAAKEPDLSKLEDAVVAAQNAVADAADDDAKTLAETALAEAQKALDAAKAA